MGFQCGIVGLPNVGKSTLFNALTEQAVPAANYPFCTIDPNVGVVAVPDSRLERIATFCKPQKLIPTTVEFVDIAGLVKGASEGEGLGNQFLGHIKNVDAIAHVLRCFENTDVVHVHGTVDPVRDFEVIETELILADLNTVNRRLERVARQAKSGDKVSRAVAAVCEKLVAHLNTGAPARSLSLTEAERDLTRDLFLLTEKPIFFIANLSESDLKQGHTAHLEALKARAAADGVPVVPICADLELELTGMAESEKTAFLSEYGLTESGLHAAIRIGYETLGLITFFTAGEIEVRAWTVNRNTKAPAAAGRIHGDFEKSFIRAEVYSAAELFEMGSIEKLKAAGRLRLEGKEYIVQDGDVVYFRTSA